MLESDGSRVAVPAAARSCGSVHWAFSGWGSMSGFASAPWPDRSRASQSKVKNCILIWLAGGPSHIDTFDPKPARRGRRPGRVQADRHVGAGPANQRGLPQPGQGHGPGDPDPEHDLARGRPRPGRPPHADRLSPVAGPGVSGLRQRRVQGPRGDARNAASLSSPFPTPRSLPRAAI